MRLRNLLASACRTSLLDEPALLLSCSCAILHQALTSPARISHASPQKSAAWPTRLLHGVLRGYRSVGGGVWPSLKPVGAAALRAHGQSGYFLSASAVSAPPYGKPCSKRGRPKLDSKLGRNAAHSGHC